MIHLASLKDRIYYVVGLAKSGKATVAALKKGGAQVYAFDDNIENGMEPVEAPWPEIDALVLSPGIPHRSPKPHPAAELARENDVPIICDVDLLAQAYPKATYISVTGTNGKSTTTALLQHLLPDAQMGGNIGRPVLDLDPCEKGTYLLELSSYQLERVPHLNSTIAVWLNISEDHLDRHGDLAGYVAAKSNIFTAEGVAQKVIIGIDDLESRKVYEGLKGDDAKSIIPLSTQEILPQGLSAIAGVLYENAQPVATLSNLPNLPGAHNHQNIAAVYGVLKALGLPFDIERVAAFQGLRHRQESVVTQGKITVVNDSKATNIESTLRALSCYDGVHLLLGGIAKAAGLKGIGAHKERIKKVYLYGQAAPQFAKELSGEGIPFAQFEALDDATNAALFAAQGTHECTTILLSPACASFDQFKNFEARGDGFKALVYKFLKQEVHHV